MFNNPLNFQKIKINILALFNNYEASEGQDHHDGISAAGTGKGTQSRILAKLPEVFFGL